MQTLLNNMRFLCDEARMLTGITVAYGSAQQSESLVYGRAQETALTQEGFVPCVRALQEDSIFDLASLTKLFTCVMAMILVEQGQLSLDETVGRIDRRVAAHDRAHVVLRQFGIQQPFFEVIHRGSLLS